jgi:hypothetical protein
MMAKRFCVLFAAILLLFSAATQLAFAKQEPAAAGKSAKNVCSSSRQDGSRAHPWKICTPEDLALLHVHPGAYFELKADLDLSGFAWTPVASFSGQLDGNNHTIANLQATGGGLFHTIAQTGKVKHLKLTGASIYSYDSGGILAVFNRGTVEHAEASGTIEGRFGLGGLVSEWTDWWK